MKHSQTIEAIIAKTQNKLTKLIAQECAEILSPFLVKKKSYIEVSPKVPIPSKGKGSVAVIAVRGDGKEVILIQGDDSHKAKITGIDMMTRLSVLKSLERMKKLNSKKK